MRSASTSSTSRSKRKTRASGHREQERVLVFGTFDRLHPGHKFFLREAMERGKLSVVIARDTTVTRIKGRPPEEPERDRQRAVEKAFPSAYVFLGDTSDFLAPLRYVRPSLILLGYDQSLPPGISEADLSVRIERLPSYKPYLFKSSKRRKK